MNNGIGAYLKLKHSQQLTPNLRQSLRILQLSSQDLEDEIGHWLADNPLLEIVESSDDSDGLIAVSAAMPLREHYQGEEGDWLTVVDEESFPQFLHKQVCEYPLNEQQAAHVHILIDFLDEQGYLSDSFTDIVDHTPLDWQLDEQDIALALQHLQRFEPAGVGARNLTESLQLQLERQPVSPEREAALYIVQYHLLEWSKNPHHSVKPISKILKITPEVVYAAGQLIESLNPFPAYGFAANQASDYVRPDLKVVPTDEGWQVQLATGNLPDVVLNQEYCQLLKENGGLNKEWREKIADARQKIDGLSYRRQLILALGEYIVSHQSDFFIFGEIGLVPMLMKDAAEALGVSESTISRAANQKYLACSRGVFALRYFFTQAIEADVGAGEIGTSVSAVKALLIELIGRESTKSPYTDQSLADILNKQGVVISRRTVAKYREALHIPPAFRRKSR